MIWSLAREQLRSQRRYALSAGILLAITVAIAVYGVLMSVSMVSTAQELDHFTGADRDQTVDVFVPGDMTVDALTEGIDQANARGDEAIARAVLVAALPTNEAEHGWVEVTSMYGDVDWTSMLVSGSAPASGEIAVSAQWATEHDVALGDVISLNVAVWGDDDLEHVTLGVSLTVSGLTKSSVTTAGIQILVPSGYVAWEDAPQLQTLAVNEYNASQPDESGADSTDLLATVSANGDLTWTGAPVDNGTIVCCDASESGSAKFFVILTSIGVGALVIGIIAMAFALGRAQAQVRSRWVATVRALGATRRQIVWATALESVVLGLAAGIVGYGLGAAAAGVHLGIARQSAEAAMLLTPQWLSPLLLGAAIVFGLVLALIVGAIPAFWSARVQPAAALKPVTDLSEAETSRRVKVWPLAITWGVCLAIATYAAVVEPGGQYWVILIAAVIVLFVGGIMLANEALRHSLPWHARRLSKSRRRAVMVAGDAILARPRQSTVPAFIAAVATCALVGIMVPLAASRAWDYGAGSSERAVDNPYISPLIFMAVFGLVTLLCVAIGAATASLTAREGAAREALGLSRGDGRLAAAVQYLTAQAHGVALGLLAGLLLAAFALPTAIVEPYSVVSTWFAPVPLLLVAIVACAAVCAVVGAAAVAALTPAVAPLAKLEATA